MGHYIEVGEKFTMFRESFSAHSDGCYFEALEDNGGFIMSIHMEYISFGEKLTLNGYRINARMIREGNKIMFLIRYGDTPLMFEATFDPTLYEDKRAMQIAFDNHMVTFISVERNDKTIQTIRQTNFPMKLKQALITAWTGAFEEKDFSKNYSEWIQNLYQYDTPTLWDMGKDVGFFGEGGIFV